MVFSLLCCGYDEDQEDKEHNQQINNSNKNPRQRGGNTTRSTVQNSSKKDSYQINDFAVAQEGDDSKNAETPSEDDSKKLQKDKKELIEEENSINETETITNTNDDNATPPQGPEDPSSTQGIITQVSEDQPVIDPNEFLMEHDIDNINLTKIQEGQYCNPKSGFLLGPREPKYKNKKCLVLDLDETLVHSSFKYLRTADFVIPVEIDNQVHHVYVIKRPGVDEFLRRVGELFEVVVFTASVSKYGDPLLDKLDKNRAVNHRLFRDACYNYQGNFIKNLSQIGRPLNETIIIDNSPSSYIFHPQHAVPISSWFSDTHDNELLDMLPFLEDLSKSNVNDVGLVLDITI